MIPVCDPESTCRTSQTRLACSFHQCQEAECPVLSNMLKSNRLPPVPLLFSIIHQTVFIATSAFWVAHCYQFRFDYPASLLSSSSLFDTHVSSKCEALLLPASLPLPSACRPLPCSRLRLRVCLLSNSSNTVPLTISSPVTGQHVYNDGDGSREQSHVNYHIDANATCGVLVDNHTRLSLQQSTIGRAEFSGENLLTSGYINNALVCAVGSSVPCVSPFAG